MNTILTSQSDMTIGVEKSLTVDTFKQLSSHVLCDITVNNVSNKVDELHNPLWFSLEDNSKHNIHKYFSKWKNYYINNKNNKLEFDKHIEQKHKLNEFIKSLKKYQKRKQSPPSLDCNKNAVTQINGQFMHRFKAQQEIIHMQKDKLIHQQRIIQQLKLGHIHDAVNESIEQTKRDMRDVLQNCSVKVKCKLKSTLILENINKELLELSINSNKAPKIVQEMEKRALEREHRRQLILERKKIIDAAKKRAVEVELSQKKTQDEEERRRNIDEMQKRRKAQLEYHRLMKAKRETFLEDCAKAECFYKRMLIKIAFRKLAELIAIKRCNFIKSKIHYVTNLRRKSLKYWKEFVAEADYARSYKAITVYNFKLKLLTFRSWFKAYILGIQHMQVAVDLSAMQLERRTFNCWHKYTCIQYISDMKNMKRAERHDTTRILLQYFYQWKSLPAIMIIERAKEEKKRKWREKVWQILPDYKPVTDDSLYL